MVFIQGSYDAPTIISLIVNSLAETDDFVIHDSDAIDNHNNTGYCLKHIPTGQYITLIAGYANMGSYSNNLNPDHGTAAGIRVLISSEWNMTTHKCSGNVSRNLIPFYNGGNLSSITSPYVFSTSMWIDKYGVVMTMQNTYANGVGVFAALEFFPLQWVEYDDAHQPIVFYVKRSSDWWGGRYSYNPQYVTGSITNEEYAFLYARPYKYSCITHSHAQFSANESSRHEGSYMERETYRSEATNKVYPKFPMYENDVIIARKPYAETRRWFKVDITGGLQIGDILNWIDPDNVTVHKYIVAVVTAGAMYYAIPYDNAFDYATSAKQ